jgi:cell division protein FtsQ
VPVTTSIDKRFLRAHARPGRHRPPWQRPLLVAARAVIVVAALVSAGYWITAAVEARGLLHVRRIQLQGVDRVSRGEVLSLLDGLRGQNILAADLETCRQRLLTSPWVAEAALRRRLPSTVEVLIAERRPIGLARVGGDLFLIDDRGGVIEEYSPKYAELDLPVIDGVIPAQKGEPSGLDDRRIGLAVRLLDGLQYRPDLLERVSQVDVSDPRDAVVLLAGDTTLVRLGDAQFADRLQSYLELAPKLHERVPGIDYVDLRFGDHVYVGSTAPGRGKAGASGNQVRF